MSAPGDPYVKRVVLPSGKTIEVVLFGDAETAAPLDSGGPSAGANGQDGCRTLPERDALPVKDLHICPECRCELVYPTDWTEEGAGSWLVSLRCPNCEWWGGGVFCQEVVDHFDEELDHGTDVLVRDLRDLMRANMADEIDRFVAALTVDAILPSDF